ncbi:hypothetical protein [Vagococcus sp. JNUCC 83]
MEQVSVDEYINSLTIYVSGKGEKMTAEGMMLKVEMNEEMKAELLDEFKVCMNEIFQKLVNVDDFRCVRKKEIAKLLGVSTQTIEKWMELGLPYIQIDNVIIYNVTNVSEWLNKFNRKED